MLCKCDLLERLLTTEVFFFYLTIALYCAILKES